MNTVPHLETFESYVKTDNENRIYVNLPESDKIVFHFVLGSRDRIYLCANPLVNRPVKDHKNVGRLSFFTPPYGLEVELNERQRHELRSFLDKYAKKKRTNGIMDELAKLLNVDEIYRLIDLNKTTLENEPCELQ